MVNLMSKTKKELVALIGDLSRELEDARGRPAGPDAETLERVSALEAERDRSLAAQKVLADELTAERERNAAERGKWKEALQASAEDFDVRLDRAARAIDCLVSENADLEDRLELAGAGQKTIAVDRDRLLEDLARSRAQAEDYRFLLEGVTENDGRAVFLLDHLHGVRFANQSARRLLAAHPSAGNPEAGIFDIFPSGDTDEMRRAFEKARVKGKKGKLKHVSLCGEGALGGNFELRLKPCRYRNRAALRVELAAKD